MPIPHEFIPGEVARSSDVNDNFAFIISLLGELTTPDRVRTSTEFQMGARQNVLLTATHDTGDEDKAFFQIGWNADWNYSGGRWRFTRFNQGEAATVLRLGIGGLEVFTTQDTNGDLNGPLEAPAFTVRRTPNGKWVHIPSDTNITHTDVGPPSMGDYRLTYVPFASVKTIHEGVWGVGTETKLATSYGVPSAAKAVSITAQVTAGSNSARLSFYRSQGGADPKKHGFTISASASDIGSGWGIVPLGETSRASEFMINRTASFSSVYAYMTGYWV